MNIALMLFEQADLLDFGGPYEVFLTASRMAVRAGQPEPFTVTTVSADGQALQAYGGMKITPQMAIADCKNIDLLIVPGGIDIALFLANKPLMQAIQKVASQPGSVVASVCTGAFLLAELGLLDDSEWTTHWEDISELSQRFKLPEGRRDVHWVDNGQVVTGAGLSSGIAMALHLVERFEGKALAEKTAKQIGYQWHSDPSIIHPASQV